MRQEGEASRYWCFTINNPLCSDEDELQFAEWNENVEFAVYNLEMGEEGTPHYQGYIELRRHKTLQWMKRRLPRAHLERRKGSREQAILYCLKDCTTECSETMDSSENNILNLPPLFPVLYGTRSTWEELKNACSLKISLKMNRKEALSQMKMMIDSGSSISECADFHFPTWVSSYRGLLAYKTLRSKPRDFKTKVIVCQGPTGTGKSKWCADTFPGAYWKQKSSWWDGYEDHKVVVVDEFYGWIAFDTCLRLCDRYPMLVETKGGNVNFVAETIVFTTNNLPTSWWKNIYFKAFARRVDEWHVFPVWGDHNVYETYEEAFPHFFNNNEFNFP